MHPRVCRQEILIKVFIFPEVLDNTVIGNLMDCVISTAGWSHVFHLYSPPMLFLKGNFIFHLEKASCHYIHILMTFTYLVELIQGSHYLTVEKCSKNCHPSITWYFTFGSLVTLFYKRNFLLTIWVGACFKSLILLCHTKFLIIYLDTLNKQNWITMHTILSKSLNLKHKKYRCSSIYDEVIY